MDIRVKKLWTSALRSGQYEQGKERLRDEDDKFCCLGVLCDLYAKEHPEAGWNYYIFLTGQQRSGYEPYFLPVVVQEWAGLDHPDPHIEGVGTLSQLNDTGSTFVEIAGVIKDYL